LIYFKGKKSTTANSLDWMMVNDDEIAYYEVQRSYNGNNFETIGSIQQSAHNYSFKDNNAEDKNIFYRIVTHDNAGNIQYSNVVMIRSSNTSTISVALMPNPVNSSATLKIDAGHAVAGTIRIVNPIGMIMFARNVNLIEGENIVALPDITRLQTGAYQVIVNAANTYSNIKMLVNR
jgi:hypothetical protein